LVRNFSGGGHGRNIAIQHRAAQRVNSDQPLETITTPKLDDPSTATLQ
jgi:hypothetical protein